MFAESPCHFLANRLTISRSSHLLPRSSLCIEPGAAVWTLYLDVVCINYDGGLLDATVLAAVAALRNSKSFARNQLLVSKKLSQRTAYSYSAMVSLTFSQRGYRKHGMMQIPVGRFALRASKTRFRSRSTASRSLRALVSTMRTYPPALRLVAFAQNGKHRLEQTSLPVLSLMQPDFPAPTDYTSFRTHPHSNRPSSTHISASASPQVHPHPPPHKTQQEANYATSGKPAGVVPSYLPARPRHLVRVRRARC